jgi:hypothetical protein
VRASVPEVSAVGQSLHQIFDILIVALCNAEKRLKTPKLTMLAMFEINLTTSPPYFSLSLHWGFQDISLGVRFFFGR